MTENSRTHRTGRWRGLEAVGWAGRRLAGVTALMLAFVWPRGAVAYDYGLAIHVSSEEDIYELYATGELTEEETERLITLLNDKIDLNRAGVEELYNLPDVTMELAEAIVSYREERGYFRSFEQVASVPGMTGDILAQVAPFCKVRFRIKLEIPLGGTVKTRVAYEFGNRPEQVDPDDPPSLGSSFRPDELGLDTLPSAYVRVRASTNDRVEAGVLASVGEGIASFVFDEASMAYWVDWGRPLLELHKAYVVLHQGAWEVIAGNYGVGFGERLVFDETRRLNPDGLYTDDEINGTTAFSTPQRLFGIGATYRGIELGPSTVEVTAFLSREAMDIYQYNLALEPREGSDDSSTVVHFGDLKLMQQTLPDAYTEQLAGAHVTARLDERNYVGLTGYFSKVFLPYSDVPFHLNYGAPRDRNRFGAVGLDFGAELWRVQLNGEGSLMDNGAAAVYLQTIADLDRGEVLASFRSYGVDFDNPHSRGFADADVLERERDRDEIGFYVRGLYRLTPWLSARGSVNRWYRPSLDVSRLALAGRIGVSPKRSWDLAFLGSWKDKDLSLSDRSRCYQGSSSSCWEGVPVEEDAVTSSFEEDYAGTVVESSEGNGARAQIGVRAKTTAIPRTRLTAFYKRTYMDDHYQYLTPADVLEYGWRVGQQVWVKGQVFPFRDTFVTLRLRYVDEDVYGDKGERVWDAYLEFGQRVPRRYRYSVRYMITRGLPGHLTYETACCGEWATASCLEAKAEGTYDPLGPPEPFEHALIATFETRF